VHSAVSTVIFVFSCCCYSHSRLLIVLVIQSGGGDSVTLKFLVVLGKSKDEEAMRLFHSASIEDDSRAPTPRSKTYVRSGEWDANEHVEIKLIV
jgi:hypothetical protein